MSPIIPVVMPAKASIHYDVIILGAGIVGLALARELKQRTPDCRILILEKEAYLGAHGSGRNSGVMHSGIYYPEQSLKAKVCAEGARAMVAYCREHDLPVQAIGKVIVPTTAQDDAQIDLLYRRGQANGARVSILDSQQLKEIEPEARSASGRALYSPDTAVIDSKAILQHLKQSLERQGVDILFNSPCETVFPDQSEVTAGNTRYHYGFLFNATGQFADRLTHLFGVGQHYTLLPFKGIYYALSPRSGLKINGLIYPVPDLNMPFLGVHSVKKITGEVYFGPTAIPAFGREHYQGLTGIELKEASKISYYLLKQYIDNKKGFRQFVHQEAWRFMKSQFCEAARALVPNLKTEYLLPSDKVGIRAQLVDTINNELVMDFLVEKKR